MISLLKNAHLLRTERLQPRASEAQRIVPCPVCQNDRIAVVLTPADIQSEQRWLNEFYRERLNGGDGSDRVSFTQDDSTFVVTCGECETLFRNPRPDAETLRERYAHDHYTSEALATLAANQDIFFRRKVRQIRERLPMNARVLEIGSFTGSFLLAAKNAGWRATGIDVGGDTTRFMRERGLDVLQGDVTELELPAREFDAVFIWNTFDQLAQPLAVLKRLHGLLREAGQLFLRVPNGRFKLACAKLLELYPERPTCEHIRRAQAYNNFMTFPYIVGYTPQSLARLLHHRGFEVGGIDGGTIVRLSDDHTPRRFALEEQRYKLAVLRLCEQAEALSGTKYYPWIDVSARKVSSNQAPLH